MQNPKLDTTPHRPPFRPAVVFATASLALACLFASLPAPTTAQAFGGAVLVADGRILVGEAAHLREPGTVRAYAFEDGRWAQVATLRGPGASVGDGFGRSLARVDDFLFVGAGGDRVHLYRLADVGGAEAAPVQTLTLPGLAGFGHALATSGSDLMVPADADGELVLAEFREGADGHWAHAGTLALGAEGTLAARSLIVGDNLAAVGSPRAGRVYVFERGGRSEDWASPAVLERPGADGDAPAMFGTVLASHGGEILVGEVRTGGRGEGGARRTGRVHRFARVDGDWAVVGTLVPEESASQVQGLFLAVHGTTLLVGTGGTMFAYAREGEDWTPTGTYRLAGDGDESLSPQTVALGDGVAALGDPSADFGMGAVSVLSSESGDWMPAAVLVADHDPLPTVTGGEVACENGEAEGYDCDHVDLLSFLPREELGAGRGARLNDIWGWTDPETGREYGLVGRMDGTSFVDVTDPYNPRYLGNLARTEGSRSSTWRDIKVFNDHAFIVADGAGAHGMQVFDLTGLRDVTEPREFAANALYTDIGSVHNLAINEETGYAYLVGSSSGGETCGGGSHIVDINDPLDPVFAGCFAHPNTGRRNTGNSHDTQCVIYHGPDEDYRGREICVNSNETALSVADVTDKDNPVAVASADYPSVAYAHQGWLTEDHRYFFSNDEHDELTGLVESTRTLIWDLADLDDPFLVREYFSPTKVTDHNLYVHGDRLYMSNNRAGLRVLDISDPENPVELGHFDTTPWSPDTAGFDGTWSVYPYFASGTILLSSRREGLFLVRPRARQLIP